MAGQTYNAGAQVQTQSTQVYEKRSSGGDQYTHTFTVDGHGMAYDDHGNLSGYDRTTVDNGQTIRERTLAALSYDDRHRLTESDVEKTQTGSDGTSQASEIHTMQMVYNSLDELIGYLRVTTQGEAATVKFTLADTQY